MINSRTEEFHEVTHTLRDIKFEWSVIKAAGNVRKHHVSFDEAETVFDDRHGYVQEDELHSDDEPRQVLIGYSKRNRLLVVSFVLRAPNRIRIVNARSATRKEIRIYEETQL